MIKLVERRFVIEVQAQEEKTLRSIDIDNVYAQSTDKFNGAGHQKFIKKWELNAEIKSYRIDPNTETQKYFYRLCTLRVN